MEKPLVSILIPTYNREKLIAESIQSALDQDYDNFEVIVVDNASTDGTWSQIQRIAFVDSRVRAFRNETNIGPVRNWIECAQQARGTFSKILWSDDLIDPTFLSRTVPLLADQRVGFVYSAARIFKEKTELASSSIYYNHLPTGVYDTAFFIEGSLLDSKYYPVSPGCFLLRTEDLQKNLLADIPNAVGSDFKSHAIGNDLLLLLLTANSYERFGVVNEPLSMFRDHAGSISTTSGIGRLILHYDMAKAYFVLRNGINKHIHRQFNTLLWLHRQRYAAKSYGIHCMQDFYPAAADTCISLFYLVRLTVKRILRSHTLATRYANLTDQVPTPIYTKKIEVAIDDNATSSKRHPLISIITAVFNGAKTLSATMDSIIPQLSAEVEYIVIDGGSTDGTQDIIEKYADHLAYWVSEHDDGIYDAWNKGLTHASGRYICFVGADDVFLPDTLGTYLSHIRQQPEIEYWCSKVAFAHIAGRVIGQPWRWGPFRRYMTVAHVGSLHHRNLYDRYGTYDTSYRIVGDYEFLLRVGNSLKAGFIDQVTVIMGSDGVSNKFVFQALVETASAKKKTNATSLATANLDYYIARFKQAVRFCLRRTS